MMQIRVAKKGKDALTATNPNDFIFHSAYNTFKIISTGFITRTLGVTGAESSFTVAHKQNYIPFVFAFCRFVDLRYSPPGGKEATQDFWFTRIGVDTTNIVFYYFNATPGNYTASFKYYVCEVPL